MPHSQSRLCGRGVWTEPYTVAGRHVVFATDGAGNLLDRRMVDDQTDLDATIKEFGRLLEALPARLKLI